MTRGSQGASRRRLNVDGNNERLLTPGEVATLFRAPGGHRRFRESEVRALLRGDSEPASQGHLTA